MGRTLPSTTQLVLDQFAELRPFYDALRRSDQLILDKFLAAILQHRAAIGNAANLLPLEIMPFVILMEERKRNNQVNNELCGRIEELENKLERLEAPIYSGSQTPVNSCHPEGAVSATEGSRDSKAETLRRNTAQGDMTNLCERPREANSQT